MLRKKISKTKSVSEKISDLITQTAHGQDESSDEQNEEPRVEDEFDEYELPDARSSDIRKRTVKLLSEQSAKYRGKISSRNELEEEEESDISNGEEQNESDDSSDSDADDADALKEFANKVSGGGGTAKSEVDDSEDEYYKGSSKFDHESENNDEDTDDEDDMNADDIEEDDADNNDDTDVDDDIDSFDNSDAENADANGIIAETNRQAEVQKGQCVQNQLQIWERLLEMRIRTQKLVSKSNQLPAPEVLKTEQEKNEKLANVCQDTMGKVSKLLSTLLQLQKACCEQFSEQRTALKKSLKRPLPIYDGDNPIPLKRYAEHLDVHFREFKPYRNTVLLKWDDRTKLLTPGAGAKKKSITDDYDIIRKIENSLQNRATLIKRSQTLKTGDDSNTDDAQAENDDTPAQSLNTEIYDDSDFYHQQLRELIEYKTNASVSASEVTQQYMELQKLRQKTKKKVDTRASKGRKLRYTVHNKLINFMAPDDTTTWTEESKDELYRSLFA